MTLDDYVRVLEKALMTEMTEVRLTGPEDDRDNVHCQLIDQAECQKLAAYVACGKDDVAPVCESFRPVDASCQVICEVVRGLGVPAFWLPPM